MIHLSISYVEINVVEFYIEANIMFNVLKLVKLHFMQCRNEISQEN